MKRALLFLLCAAAACAQSVESIPFRAILSAKNVGAPPVDPNGSGMATIWLHVVRDLNGNITSGAFDYSASYQFAESVTIRTVGIEATYPGTSGASTGIVFPVTLNLTNPSGAGSIPTSQAQFTSASAPAINALLAGTGSFFFNIRTVDSPAGAAGGLLIPADFTVAMGLMNGGNEVPPVQGTNASAVAAITALRTLDAVGNITSAYLIFDVDYTGFTAATNLTGLNLTFAQTSTVAIDSGLAGSIAVNPAGAGNLHYETEVNLTRAHADDVIYALFSIPSSVYINLQTVASPAGAVRAQLSSTDDMVFPVILTPSPSLNLTVSAPANIHARTIRLIDGSIPAGVMLFDVDPLFSSACPPGCTTFTSLEIRDAAAGGSGPVSIDTSLNSQPILTSNGVGNISRSVTVTAGAALAALQDLVLFPENHYVELETGAPALVVRSPLAPVDTDVPVVTAAISAISDPAQTIAAPLALMSVYGSNFTKVATNLDGFGVYTSLPFKLNGTSVTIAGEPAALVLVAPGQINLQVPVGVPPGLQSVVVSNVNGPSATFSIPVQPVAPNLYNAVVRQNDWSLIGPSNPANAGDILLVYGTGFGQTSPPLNTGAVAPSQPFSFTQPATVTVAGTGATVYYSLAAPGQAGVYIVAFQMPALPGLPSNVTLQIAIGGASSNLMSFSAAGN